MKRQKTEERKRVAREREKGRRNRRGELDLQLTPKKMRLLTAGGILEGRERRERENKRKIIRIAEKGKTKELFEHVTQKEILLTR